jgi:hypothetical protein
VIGRRQLPAEVTDLTDSTGMGEDGAVHSIQSATVRLPVSELDARWNAHWLERLARTYWRFLSRITLGLIRVIYTDQGREVVLLGRPLRLLTFHTPEYGLEPDRGTVTWRIAKGLLVSRPDEGFLKITVARSSSAPEEVAEVRVDVEVSNFYPAIAARISDHLYRWTQSKIHVLVTWGFLRSLARGDLAQSRAGQFAAEESD